MCRHKGRHTSSLACDVHVEGVKSASWCGPCPHCPHLCLRCLPRTQEATTLAIRCIGRSKERNMTRHGACRVAASVLTKVALERGSRDNITVIVVGAG